MPNWNDVFQEIQDTQNNLKNQSQVTEFKGKTEYRWVVTTACPEIK